MSQDTLKYDDPPVTRSSSPIKRTPSPIEKRILTKSSSGRFRARSPPLEREKSPREDPHPTSISSRRNSSAPKAAPDEQRQKPTAKKLAAKKAKKPMQANQAKLPGFSTLHQSHRLACSDLVSLLLDWGADAQTGEHVHQHEPPLHHHAASVLHELVLAVVARRELLKKGGADDERAGACVHALRHLHANRPGPSSADAATATTGRTQMLL